MYKGLNVFIIPESEDEDDLTSEPKESDKSANPYPVTIIPKFGALPSKSTSKQGRYGNNEIQ